MIDWKRDYAWDDEFGVLYDTANRLRSSSNKGLANTAFDAAVGFKDYGEQLGRATSESQVEAAWTGYLKLAKRFIKKCEALTK